MTTATGTKRTTNETQLGDIRKFAKSAGDLIGSVESAAMSGETDRLKAGAAALRIYLDALERMAEGKPREDTAFASEAEGDEGTKAAEGTAEPYEKRVRKAAEKIAPGEDVQTAMTKLAKSDEGKRLKRETNQARALEADLREGMSKAGDATHGGNVEEQIKRMAKSRGISVSEAYRIVKSQQV